MNRTTNCDFVTIQTSAGELHGLFRRQDPDNGLVVHVHGTGGDFYSNPFIGPLGDLYQALGLSYLTANFPGWGSNAAEENYEDFFGALDAWIDSVGARSKVILQGHSLGALKIMSYLRKSDGLHSHSVKGALLLSPFDIVAFYRKSMTMSESEEAVLKQMALTEGPQVLVPSSVFSYWPMSVGTLLGFIQNGNPADEFPTRLNGVGVYLSHVSVPTMVVIGGNDFAAFPTPGFVASALNSLSDAESVLLDGAPHNFAGRVEALVSAISPWVQQLLKQH